MVLGASGGGRVHIVLRYSRSSSSSSSTIVDHCYTVGLGTVRVAREITSGSGGVTVVCGRVNSGHHLSQNRFDL